LHLLLMGGRPHLFCVPAMQMQQYLQTQKMQAGGTVRRGATSGLRVDALRASVDALTLPDQPSITPGLASLLFAIALVRTNKPYLLTAVLPVASAVLAPLHSRSLGDGDRHRPVGDNGGDSDQESLAREHVLCPPVVTLSLEEASAT
jgi:hypothetical protein